MFNVSNFKTHSVNQSIFLVVCEEVCAMKTVSAAGVAVWTVEVEGEAATLVFVFPVFIIRVCRPAAAQLVNQCMCPVSGRTATV